jgi:hypothetical protein
VAKATADLEPVDPRQADVEDHELGRDVAEAGERVLPGRCDRDRVTLALESDLEAASDGGLVLDDHDG